MHKKRCHSLLIVTTLFLITACSTRPMSERIISPIYKKDSFQTLSKQGRFIEQPTPDNYSICMHNTCGSYAYISLNQKQWDGIRSLFSPIAHNAEYEREQIKKAIAQLEIYTGIQAGTSIDKAENDLSSGIKGQMDCIDEATNSSIYIRLIDEAGLLKWHQQAPRTSRSIFSGNLPHNTATIVESETHKRFAVDSWFEANGIPPHIVPLEQWKSGWKP